MLPSDSCSCILDYQFIFTKKKQQTIMDKAIFQFHFYGYSREEVAKFSRSMCEKLCVSDEENVTKFDLSDANTTLQNLLNDELLDTTNCFYRVFI